MRYVAGVDLGGTNTKIGIVDENGSILGKHTIKTESINGVEVTFERIYNEIKRLEGEVGVTIESIGIGIPGPVKDRSIVRFFANFPWDKNLNCGKIMEELSGVPTRLDNDVNVIALGEARYGAGKGYKSSVTIALGTGIGGGIYVDGNLLSGFSGAAGEVGHMKLVDHGRLCGCGQKGCFEAYASATGLIREGMSRLAVHKTNLLYETLDGRINDLEAKDIFDCARKGDKFSLDLVDYEAKHLAMGIGNILNIINPEVIIIGGGVGQAGPILTDRVKEYLLDYAIPAASEGVKFLHTTLGNDAGIAGAGALGFECILK